MASAAHASARANAIFAAQCGREQSCIAVVRPTQVAHCRCVPHCPVQWTAILCHVARVKQSMSKFSHAAVVDAQLADTPVQV